MMNEILNYLVESVLILSVFILFYHFILEKEKCYHFNRGYLLLTPLLSLILPLLHIQVHQGNPVAQIVFPDNLIILPEVRVTDGIIPASNAPSFNWTIFLASIYVTGLLFFLARFLVQITHIGLLFMKYGKTFIKRDKYKLVYTMGELPTFSFFNYIFWDTTRNFEPEEESQIMAHELKHIQERHTLDMIYLTIMSIIFWFNPWVHLYQKKLSEVHEFIADDVVIQQVDRSDYASFLARMALSRIQLPASSFFDKSKTLKRIEKMKSQKQNTNILKLLAIIPVIGIIFLVFSCQDDSSAGLSTNAPHKVAEKAAEGMVSPPSAWVDDGDQIQLIISEDEIMKSVDNLPTPVEGLENFYKAIQKEMKYPAEAKENGIEGQVFIEFVVDKEGNIRNVKTLKGIAYGCDEEAERVMNTINVKWNPAVHEDQLVNCRMVLPIAFKLN